MEVSQSSESPWTQSGVYVLCSFRLYFDRHSMHSMYLTKGPTVLKRNVITRPGPLWTWALNQVCVYHSMFTVPGAPQRQCVPFTDLHSSSRTKQINQFPNFHTLLSRVFTYLSDPVNPHPWSIYPAKLTQVHFENKTSEHCHVEW